MNGLMLHCGAAALTRTELATLPAPDARGSRHVCRPFIDDVELVNDQMRTNGIHIQDESFGVTYDEDGAPRRFFGLMQILIQGLAHNDSYGLMIGLRGSYDQSLARTIAVGSRVFVCDNLAFSGKVQISTKQTTNVAHRVPELIARAIGQIPQMAEAQDRRFNAYRNQTLTQDHGDHMLIDLVRQHVLMPSQLERALQEWDEPSHPEHAEQGLNAWRLHNAVTEAIKPSNPERMALPQVWQRTQHLTGYLDQACLPAAA